MRLQTFVALAALCLAGCDDSAKKAEQARVAAEAQAKAAADAAQKAAAEAQAKAAAAKEAAVQTIDEQKAAVLKVVSDVIATVDAKMATLKSHAAKMPKAAKAKGAAALKALADAKAALVGLKKQLESLTDAPAFAELSAKVQAAVEKVHQALADAEATVASGAKKPKSKK